MKVSTILKNIDPETYKVLRFVLYAFIIFVTNMANAVLIEKTYPSLYAGTKPPTNATTATPINNPRVTTSATHLGSPYSTVSSRSATGFSCTRSSTITVNTGKRTAIVLINNSLSYQLWISSSTS